jgi:hypothetical protein
MSIIGKTRSKKKKKVHDHANVMYGLFADPRILKGIFLVDLSSHNFRYAVLWKSFIIIFNCDIII